MRRVRSITRAAPAARTRRWARLLTVGAAVALGLLATGCPGDNNVNPHGFAYIDRRVTTSEHIRFCASQSTGQPAIRAKIVSVFSWSPFGNPTYWAPQVAKGNGPVVCNEADDGTPFVGVSGWQLWTCLESNHNDCRLQATWP